MESRHVANLSNIASRQIALLGTPAHALPPPPAPLDHWQQGVHLEALANLAHELRSPVQALLGYLDIIRDELGAALSSRHSHILERMNANAQDLAQTVENVMDFSVADAMAEAADPEEIDLHELIEELAPALEAANSKGLQIKYDLEDAPCVFRSRRRPFKAILLNLAINAIRFTEKGIVTIAIRGVASPEVGPALELAVRDTGPGIDAELLARAFRPCAQLSSSSTRRHRGIGLGLAVVQRNVTALGASIAVNSTLGDGSAFVVTIPIVSH